MRNYSGKHNEREGLKLFSLGRSFDQRRIADQNKRQKISNTLLLILTIRIIRGYHTVDGREGAFWPRRAYKEEGIRGGVEDVCWKDID